MSRQVRARGFLIFRLGRPLVSRIFETCWYLPVAVYYLLNPASGLVIVASVVSTEETDLQEVLLEANEIDSNRQRNQRGIALFHYGAKFAAVHYG